MQIIYYEEHGYLNTPLDIELVIPKVTTIYNFAIIGHARANEVIQKFQGKKIIRILACVMAVIMLLMKNYRR